MEYHDKNIGTRASIDGGCFKKTMERALPLELSEELGRRRDARLNVFSSRRVTRFPLFTPPPPYFENALIHFIMSANQPVDYVEKLSMLDDEVADEFKDVIAGTSDRISLEEAADDAR